MIFNLKSKNVFFKNVFFIISLNIFSFYNSKTRFFLHWNTNEFFLLLKKVYFFFLSLQKQSNFKFYTASKFPFYSNFYHYFFEFRLRLNYLVFSLLTAFLTCYYYCFEIIYIFTKPFLRYVRYFIFTDLAEAFYTSVEISFLFSLYTVVPLLLYHFWCFLIPSKFENERKKLNFVFFFIFIFFLLSIILVYLFLLPKLYMFLLNFQIDSNLLNLQLEARIKSYVQLVRKIFILSAFFSQFPLIFFLFIKVQYIKMNILIKNRIKIFFFVLIVSSLFSPPDIFIQLSVSFFLIVFLEILFILGFFYEKILMNKKKMFNYSLPT